MKKFFIGLAAACICVSAMIENPIDAFVKVLLMALVCIVAAVALDKVEAKCGK